MPFNDYAYVFDFFDYFWRAENHLEVTAAVLIWSKLSEAEKDAVAVQSASEEVDFLTNYAAKATDKKYEYCKSVMTAISQQDFKIAKLFPADSELLRKLFSERHSNKNFVRDNDITIGCVKRFYNEGAKSFPPVQQACECTTKTILAKGTSEEIDRWLAEEDKSVILQEAWAAGLIEALQACRPSE